MKSIRKDLFECLDKHGEQTMDDLVNRIDGYTRGQLSNNLQAARKEELIATRRDDVTGGQETPGYIEHGRAWTFQGNHLAGTYPVEAQH